MSRFWIIGLLLSIIFQAFPSVNSGTPSSPNEAKNRVRRFTRNEAARITEFWLYTRKNTATPQILHTNMRQSVENSNYNPDWPIRIQIHGFRSRGNSSFNQKVRDAYLMRGDFNVIVIQWGALSSGDYEYNSKAGSINHIADIVAEFIVFMNKEFRLQYNQTYLIGHSLGAHIAGFISNVVFPERFHTIFALDPAGPMFENEDDRYRIDGSDATYVESIHTNTNLLGIGRPSGQASFYPNFGTSQSGCSLFKMGCSHSRSYRYFAESINFPFMAKRCNDLNEIHNGDCTSSLLTNRFVLMGGEPSRPNRTGVYYAPVNSHKPYSANLVNADVRLSFRLFTMSDPNYGRHVWMHNIQQQPDYLFRPTVLIRVIICDVNVKTKNCLKIKDNLVRSSDALILIPHVKNFRGDYKTRIFDDDIALSIVQFLKAICKHFNIPQQNIQLLPQRLHSPLYNFVRQFWYE